MNRRHPTMNLHSRRTGALAITAIALTTALALTGCTADGGDTASGPVKLEFWNGLTGSDKASVDELVADFNASQDEIEVTSTAMPWDVLKQKLLASIASGDGPDVVSIDTADLAQFVEAGALQPVDDFYGSGRLDDENLVAAAVDATELSGEKYGIPLNFF